MMSKFIQEWWGKRDSVTLIARPRRFKNAGCEYGRKFFSLPHESANCLKAFYMYRRKITPPIAGNQRNPAVFLSLAGSKRILYGSEKVHMPTL